MHCAGAMQYREYGDVQDVHIEQQNKVLLSVVIAFCSDGIQSISSYLLKYGIGTIVVDALRKYNGVTNPHQEDVAMSCKLVDFLSMLLSASHKWYAVLESQLQASQVVHETLVRQKNSYRTYQPLLESCHYYNKMVRKAGFKQPNNAMNGVNAVNAVNTMNAVNGQTAAMQQMQQVQQPQAHQQAPYCNWNNQQNNPWPNGGYYHPQRQQPTSPPHGPQMSPHQLQQYRIMQMHAMQQRMRLQQQQQQQQQAVGMSPNNPIPPNTPNTPNMHKMQSQWAGVGGHGQQHQQQHRVPPQRQQPPQPQRPQQGMNAKDVDSAESAEIAENMNRKWTNSSEHSLASKMHSALITLLESGSVMTKYPSIHTSTPNHLAELDKMKSKPKLVRISADWQTIEFHNVQRNGKGANVVSTHKPPKVLPIGNMKRIESSFASMSSPSLMADKNRRVFSKKKHSKNLWIYALDKTGKEIVIKLVCPSVNDTKRWTRALTQIVSHFKM